MKAWERIEPTTVTKVGWRTIVTKTFKMPDGSVHTWDTKDREGMQYVSIIALTPDNEVIIARQFRPGPEQVFEELPGGGVDPGEEPEAAARRELLEETGYAPAAMEYLGKTHRDAHNNATWHCFLATGCTLQPGDHSTDEQEYVDVQLVSIDTLLQYGRSNRMTDTEMIFLAYEKLLALQGKKIVNEG